MAGKRARPVREPGMPVADQRARKRLRRLERALSDATALEVRRSRQLERAQARRAAVQERVDTARAAVAAIAFADPATDASQPAPEPAAGQA